MYHQMPLSEHCQTREYWWMIMRIKGVRLFFPEMMYGTILDCRDAMHHWWIGLLCVVAIIVSIHVVLKINSEKLACAL